MCRHLKIVIHAHDLVLNFRVSLSYFAVVVSCFLNFLLLLLLLLLFSFCFLFSATFYSTHISKVVRIIYYDVQN